MATVPAACSLSLDPVAPPGPAVAPPSPRANGHINGVTWRKCAPKTFIEIDIAGYKQKCLLGNGCDYTLIPRQLVPTATLTLVSLDIYVANGARIDILECMTMQFHSAGRPLVL